MENIAQDGMIINNLHVVNLKGSIINAICGNGLIPLGGIIPIGYNYDIAASGIVNEKGFIRCDGQPIPSGNSVTGNTPNLSISVFVKYKTSLGASGGSNSLTLTTSQMTSHNHSLGTQTSHSTGSHSHSVSGGTMMTATHTHNSTTLSANSDVNGGMVWYEASSLHPSLPSSNTFYNLYTPYTGSNPKTLTQYAKTNGTASSSTSSTTLAVTTTNSSHIHYANSASISYTGSGTVIDITPKYFNVIYVMRVL